MSKLVPPASNLTPSFSLPEDEERNLSAGLDNVIELMVEAESEGEEGEDEGIGEETGVYYSDKSDAIICRFPVTLFSFMKYEDDL